MGRLNIVKMFTLPNLSYTFNDISVKIPGSYFVNIYKLILKFIWIGQRPRIANVKLKKTVVGRLTPPGFKTWYKYTVIKTVWHRQRK